MMYNREGRYWEKVEVITVRRRWSRAISWKVITSLIAFSQYLPSLLNIISYYLPELEMDWVNCFIIQVCEWVILAMQWSYFGPIENVWEVQIWIFVDVHSIWKWGHWYWVIWDFPPGWHANHNCEYIQTFTFNENVAKSDVLMKKSVDLFINHKFTF